MPVDLTLGNLVTFRSKNATDNVLWKGVISGVINYDMAKLLKKDIVNYQTAVLKTVPTTPDIKTLTFFLIKLSNTVEPTKVFATEWIEDGSFVVLDAASSTTITIYEMSELDKVEIVNILKAKGYHVVVTDLSNTPT